MFLLFLVVVVVVCRDVIFDTAGGGFKGGKVFLRFYIYDGCLHERTFMETACEHMPIE